MRAGHDVKQFSVHGFCLLVAACGADAGAPSASPEGSVNQTDESPSDESVDVPSGGTSAPPAGSSGSSGDEQVNVGGLVGTDVQPKPAATPDVQSPAEPSSGCGQAPSAMSGEQAIDVEGTARSFVLDVPESYDPNVPLPLVFGFHGATTSGSFFRSAFYGNLLSAMGDEAIVVHPDALGEPTAWNAAADVPFFDALLETLTASLCVDESRVFATGHSSGGFFTNTLGCQRGDVLRAIAPVSGGGPFVFGNAGCTGEVAVWLAHAENDEVVVFENGEQSLARWIELNGCDGDVSAPASPDGCVDYGGCREGLPVRWCVYQDGHNWPDFAPEGMWDFFGSL